MQTNNEIQIHDGEVNVHMPELSNIEVSHPQSAINGGHFIATDITPSSIINAQSPSLSAMAHNGNGVSGFQNNLRTNNVNNTTLPT